VTDMKTNPCTAGANADGKPAIWAALANVECGGQDLAKSGGGVQSGADVTVGSNGTMTAGLEPITAPYGTQGMCPVNVHWHLGAEHKNTGTFDQPPPANLDANTRRRLASTNEAGHWCPAIDGAAQGINMADDYAWEHCSDMHVGYTYELHWPHSNFGMCGSEWQYQSHFMDGVLCQGNAMIADTAAKGLVAGQAGFLDIAGAVGAVFSGATDYGSRTAKLGVHAQVFTLTNDAAHDYPEWDMMSGFNTELAEDVAIYQGSTTGQKNGNEDCRATGGMVTWQVDRGCHKISARAMDYLCKQMKEQADDMSSDTHPHNARETTAAAITTDIPMTR